jgi:hypothetical protein
MMLALGGWHMRTASLLLLAFCLPLAAVSATAQQTLYENGPIDGQTLAWTINFGFEIDDSFYIASSSAQVNGVAFGAWLFPGDTLESVEVSITSQPAFGTTYFDGVVNFAQSGCVLNSGNFDVCTETGSFSPVTLSNGTYYLNLQNAVTAEGNMVYWDQNNGVGCHSEGCPSLAFPDFFESIPSESFTMLGSNTSTGTTPEPGSIALFASGVLGLGTVLRRKLRNPNR